MSDEPISLPGFELQRELGRGAMGVVYAMRQPALDRVVAVKVLPKTGGARDAELRFLREVRLCMELSHPHVVKVVDAGETEQWMWLAMELMEGHSLDRVLAATGALPPAQLLMLMEQLADALDFVHSKDIVHRDIKPANVMLSANAAKLMDFGLARGISSQTLTAAQVVVGSPRFLAPETITAAVMNRSSDLYSLGVSFHEMATGASPHSGLELKELLRKIVTEPFPAVSRLVPGFPPEVERVIMALLEKDPARRTPSAAALLAEVRAVRSSPEFLGTSWETLKPKEVLPAPRSRTGRSRSVRVPAPVKTSVPVGSDSFVLPKREGRAKWAAAAAAVALVAGVALWALRPSPAPAPEPPPAASSSAAPSADPAARLAAIDGFVRAVGQATLGPLVDSLEREVGRASGVPKDEPASARAARIDKAREIARARLERLPLARAYRELTGAGPFEPRPAGAKPVLADGEVPVATRRRLYEALLFLSHLDELLVHRCGVGAAFAAQDELAPWARVIEPAGTDPAALEKLCGAAPGRSIRLHHNEYPQSLYLFSGLRAVTRQEVLVVGPIESEYSKSEDVPLPIADLHEPYTSLELHALTEDVDRMRWIELAFRKDGDTRPSATLLLRPLHPGNPNAPRILGLAVSPELLPPARYELRIRAFRLVGAEDGGCRMKTLCARVR